MSSITMKCAISVAILSLVACHVVAEQKTTGAPKSQLEQICREVKQDIIMNSVHNVPQEGGNNPTEEARLHDEFEKYHCDRVLNETAIPRSHH
jgi:hypothetical protein